MRAYERFLNYVKINTRSDPANAGTNPSSECQFELAGLLKKELEQLGLSGVRLEEHAYVYGYLPATAGYEDRPKIGFIAHMDTSPDFNSDKVKPVIHENYDGGDVLLSAESGMTLSVSDFPHLEKLRGRTLITSDGTTLLGADDKAGIAEIMTMLDTLTDGKIPHGRIAVCFTPDEEIGSGTDNFDIESFGCEYAYTVDGGEEGEIVWENFNAAAAYFTINGFSVHPGSSKDTMINASLVAMEINSMLPSGDTPRNTEDREGFYHLSAMNGNVSKAQLRYIVRDHDPWFFEFRLQTLRHIAALVNEKYGDGTVVLEIIDQYRNMAEKIKPCFFIVENAKNAIREAGLEAREQPIRGGTDGAFLSYKGLPCPNLGTGGYAFHGPCEHVTAEGMDKASEIIINIVKIFAEKA